MDNNTVEIGDMIILSDMSPTLGSPALRRRWTMLRIKLASIKYGVARPTLVSLVTPGLTNKEGGSIPAPPDSYRSFHH